MFAVIHLEDLDCRYLIVDPRFERTGPLYDRAPDATAAGHQPASAVPTSPGDSKATDDFKHQLAIVLGCSDRLLESLEDDDPRKPDVAEIRTATVHALQMVRAQGL